MLKHPRKVRVEKNQDVNNAVDGVVADGAPRMLVRDGQTIAVILTPQDYHELSGELAGDIWSDYSPERARSALQAGAGALAGVDRIQLLRDLRAARGQASAGRPD